MRVGRVFGWLLIVAALADVGREIYLWLALGQYHIIATGEFWYGLDPGSLNLFQAVVQRYVSPGLWDYTITPILLAPAWLVCGLPGIILLLLHRSRDRRKRRKSGRFA